jgi:hypothetical protein
MDQALVVISVVEHIDVGHGLFADWFVQVERHETRWGLRGDALDDGIGGSGGDDAT